MSFSESGLDPSLDEMRRLGYAAVDRAVEQLATLGDKRVAGPPDGAEFDTAVAEPCPDTGRGLDETIDRYFDRVLPHATNVHHPRFFAYVPGPGSFAGAIGEWLAASTNCFVGTWLGGAVMARLELEVLGWLRQALGLPAELEGVLTSGGSMANLTALATARSRVGGDPSRMVVWTSDEAHYSVAKAARVLGVPAAQIESVPTDAHTQVLDFEALRSQIKAHSARGHMHAVVATMGTTSTGAIDPIDRIADLLHDLDRPTWLHVDGAYGAALALLPEQQSLRALLTRADSITLDPHKWLYAPFESGCFFTRHLADLHAAFTADGAYMQDVPRDEVNFFERGPELSRGNRALKLWTLFRSVGFDAIRAAIRRDCELCSRAHDALAADQRIEIVTEPRMSVFSFTLAGQLEPRASELVAWLLREGKVMLSTTRVAGRFAIRFCVANHRTTEADVDLAVSEIVRWLDTSVVGASGT